MPLARQHRGQHEGTSGSGPAPAGRPDDDGPSDPDAGSLRRCILTGQSYPPERMIRFVVGPDGVLAPDLDHRLPGRGLWLCAGRAMLETACAKAAFARAARAAVRVPAELPETVERLLRARCLDWIGLARRAGALTWGFERVRQWLSAGKVAVVVAASDGSPAGRAKVRAPAEGCPVVEDFTAAELGRALGQESVVHAVISPGATAEKFLAAVARLHAFVSDGAPERREMDE